MSNHLFPNGKQRILEGSIAILTDSIKLALIGSGYTQSDTHTWYSDLGANVISTPVAMASKTSNVPTGGVFNAASVTFPAVASGSTISGLVIYKDTGTTTTSPLIVWYDTKADSTAISVATNGGDVTVNFSTGASRVFQL